MKNLIYILFAFPILGMAQTPSQTQNYIVTTSYLNGYISGQEGTATDAEKIVSVQYFDGLGRPIQTIGVKAGGQSQDIITHIEYDFLGRQAKEYLPYTAASNDGGFRSDALNATNTYYDQSKYDTDFPGMTTATINPYSEKLFEPSPLNRVLEQTAPGASWKAGTAFDSNGHSDGHSIKFDRQANTATEVKLYTVSLVYSGTDKIYIPTLNGGGSSDFYAAGELYKTITKDENWKPIDGLNRTTEEFKDKQGRVVLKRTYNNSVAYDTYYVYDHYGNLTYVLPPKAEPHAAKPDATELAELCYQYRYDDRNRLIKKKIPGKGWEEIVYDRLDRPVMTRDAELTSSGKWLVTKYDPFGRVAYTAVKNATGTRISFQNLVNNDPDQFETRLDSGADYLDTYYSSVSKPNIVDEIYTVSYYDDYSFDLNGGTDPGTVYGKTTLDTPKGLPTGTKVKVLGTTSWITTVTYYDDKGRAIYTYTKNEFLGTTDIVENKFDFTGTILESKTTHKKTGKADLVIIDTYIYDHMNRLIKQTQKINSQAEELIAKNTYDEVGQLIKKEVGGTNAGNNSMVTTFKDLVGVDVTGDIITKTTTTGWGNSGLATEQVITGDGYVAYEMPQTNKYLMVGLSSGNASATYSTIDYAIYNRSSGQIYIYEEGVDLGSFGTYQTGDTFRVERVGSTIYYKQNGTVLYTSTVPSTGNLLGDVAIYSNDGKIKNLSLNGSVEGNNSTVTTFKDLVGVDVTGNIITKTTATGWGNSGLATEQVITGDGYVAYEMPQTDRFLMVGLSSGNASASYSTIDYAIYNRSSGQIYIYESGVDLGSFGTYQTGDTFRVERVGSTIYYKQNGTVLYTSTVPSTGNLLGDVAIYSNDGKIKDLILVDATASSGAEPLQVVDYQYNIRGWLTDINDVNSIGDDLFAFNIRYDNPDLGTALYNGNISQTYWRSKNTDQSLKNYRYSYDALNRITSGIDNTGNYNLSSVTYDKNGNILSLTRNGHRNSDATSFGIMDNLEYNYYGYSNKVQNVQEVSGGHATYGFKNGAYNSIEFTYDANGNMLKDLNKGIGTSTTNGITYNHLNLPSVVDFGSGNKIEYFYDASGVKLKKVVTEESSVTTTEYAGNVIYKNNTLQFVNTPEGYVEENGTGGYRYVYQYKDHLGNIRVSYTDYNQDGSITQDEIVEEHNYYPFGLEHKGYNNMVNGVENNYFNYNGKELEESLGLNWLDYGARMYDAAIGRWHVTDGKAELYFANSPYNYALNTPVNAIDPDGNLVIFINGLGGGGASYWRGSKLAAQKFRYNTFTQTYQGSNFKSVPYAFDVDVSNHLVDHKRMYIDGSPGSLFNNFTSGQRYQQGYEEGLKQAAAIIGSLARDPQGNITETIKIITHSMGGVYGKGFVAALKYYIKTSKDPQVRKALITLVADFDPFQAGGKLGKADKNTYTQQFINAGFLDLFNAGFLANEEEEDADQVIENENKTSHFIETFLGNISDLQEGKYEWDEDNQEWICTTCND